MVTIHDNIDELLAADLHGELSESEREELHTHLMECADCRLLHKEEQLMNKVLQSTLEAAKPHFGFEQRMLSSFRNRVPNRSPRLTGFFVNVMRWRAIQVIGAGAACVALVQIGRILTGEDTLFPLMYGVRLAAVLDSIGFERGAPDRQTNTKFGASTGQDVGRDIYANRTTPAKPTEVAEKAKTEASPSTPPESPSVEKEHVIVTGSNIPTAEETAPNPSAAPLQPNRKLIRNAAVQLEVRSFNEAVQQIASFTTEDKGYIVTSSSEKLENGKLRGEVVVKVLPENLDTFLGKLHAIGELKNQSIVTEDVTKQYFDTDSRLNNARLMEARLIEILKKKSDDINDLLQVEKELGRVREQIEQMQGELKYMDAQVQFATVTISLAEKEMDVPAGFLLKERVQLSLFAAEVEKVYAEIKGLASSIVQITNATLDRDNAGRIAARIGMLIAPENSDDVIAKVKAMGRIENFQVQSERVARGGQGMSQDARTEYDKVQLNITISQEDREQARQQTSLSIRASDVNEQSKQLRELAEKQGGRIRSSSFSRDPNGRDYADVALRVPMQNYNALMQSLSSLGKLENVSVHRDDRPNSQIDEKTAPADVSVQVYSQGNLLSEESSLLQTLRRTIEQGATALMWSVRMIGVALAFLAPWIIALAAAIGVVRGIRRSRHRRES